MKIALVSLNQVDGDLQENRRRVIEAVESLEKEERVDWILFPEMTLTGYTMRAQEMGEPCGVSSTIDFFRELARRVQAFIAFGMIQLADGAGRPTNRLVCVSPQGELIANYAKIHPFSFAHENERFDAGDELGIVEWNGVKIGLTICYDLRFPELYQALSKECSVLFNIANWPERRVAHWELLLTARAIENQTFVAGVNRQGEDRRGLNYRKSSRVVSPQGEVLVPQTITPEVDLYTIDLEEVARYRAEFPVKRDRREELYAQFFSSSKR